MRCTICGARLKKEGDICKNCYKEYQEDELIKADKKEVLKIKRKYSINYEITKYSELIIIFIICFVIFLLTKRFLEAFFIILIAAVVFGILLFWDKRVAAATKAVFHEKSVKYTFKFLFLDTDKTVKYKDITDIVYYQTFRQKKYGYGDICIYAKGAIPGKTLLNGFQVKNIENVVERVQEIKNIIGLE